MKLRENRLMLIWLFCVSVMFFGCVVAYFQGWWGMINAGDHTKLSFLIFGIFLVGLIKNGKNTFGINRELKNAMRVSHLFEKNYVNKDILNVTWKDSDTSLVVAHVMNLNKIASQQKSGDIDQTPLIDIMVAELEAPETWTRHIAMTLASLGLLGTLIGFVMSMAGLDTLMSMDKTTMIQGLQKAIHGMSTAFYATLTAVIFGAVFLESLHRLVSNSTTKLVITLAKLGEVYIIPGLKVQYRDTNSTAEADSETSK